jgi:hydroxyacylglutathione hydrolase
MASKRFPTTLFVIGLLLTALPSLAELSGGSIDARWDEGATDCKTHEAAPLQTHAYNPTTYILRESLCSTFEAPFIYLLIGSQKALLIDTGDVGDPKQMPLAETVMALLPSAVGSRLPLLVVHTHRHLDHRSGDGQFANLPNVQVVGFDVDSVRRYYHFKDWPNGVAQIDLGDRTIEVIPTPGHNETEVSFYDRDTGLFFSGDFLMPGRLLIDDTSADRMSAERVAAFVKERPVTYVLGGHIELNQSGELFPWQSQYHPGERPLQMSKDDLLALPAAVNSFNGFYTKSGNFTLMNPVHNLIALGTAVLIVLVALVFWLVRFIRSRRRRALGQ